MAKVFKADTTKRHTKQKPNAGTAAAHVTKVAYDPDKSSTAALTASPTSVSIPRNALVAIKKQIAIDRTMIETAAYYKAEKRHFSPGGEFQDWLEAEAELGLLR